MAKGKRSAPFTVSFGGEPYLLDLDLERAKQATQRHVILLDGASTNEDEIVSECETRSFDGTDRIVIVDNAQKIAGKDGVLQRYIDGKNPEDDSAILVAIVRADKLSSIWVDAGKKGRILQHQAYKPWEMDKKAARVVQEAKSLGLKLDKDVAELLIKVTGDNLRQCVNELRKMPYLVGEGELVTQKHVALVASHMYPAEPYDVSKAAVSKTPKKAMTFLSHLYKHMGEGTWVPTVVSLQRLVEKLVVARQMLDSGEPHALIGRVLGITSEQDSKAEFAFRKNWLPIVSRHSVTELLRYMENLCELESQVKGPARSKRTLVELAVLRIAA